MNRFEQKKIAIERVMREKVDAFKAIYKAANDEKREPTEEERLEIESYLRELETLKEEKAGIEEQIKTIQHVNEVGLQLGPSLGQQSAISVGSEPVDRMFQAMNQQVFPHAQKSIGEQFVTSQGYKSAVERYKMGGGEWHTGMIPIEAKGTLLEGAGAPGSGTGGGLIPIPQVIPGVVQKQFQRLSLSDLILSGQATNNTIRYIVEGTATSGAAGVGEGGTKPESTLSLSTTDEPIKKIATLLPVSDEMLEDAPQIQSYINGRLSLFVRIEEERQLFRGVSGGNEVQGILTSRSVPIYAGGTAVGNYAIQIFAAMNGMRGSAFVEPEWVVMHPTDYQKLRLLTDSAGQFFGGGPFLGQYGTGSNLQASGQVTGANDQVWNKPVIVTAGIGGAGTALVGTHENAQVWRKGGVSVEATNAHSTYFAQNLLAIRAEERIGLAVYRPGGYVEVRLA